MKKEKRFCAYCGHHREVYTKKHVSFFDVLASAFFGLLVVAVFKQQMDPRGFLLGAIGVGFSEVFIGLRYRLRLICGRCGFDPVLYRRDPNAAAQRVKQFREERMNNPILALAEPGRPVALNPEFRQRFKSTRSVDLDPN